MLGQHLDRVVLADKLFVGGSAAPPALTPFMEDRRERTHETVHLGVLEGLEVVYVAKFGGHRQAATPPRIGGRMPLYCTAIWQEPARALASGAARRRRRGRPRPADPEDHHRSWVLHRQLGRVVETGTAYEYEESAMGLVCVAAPVLDGEDRAVAAISVTGPVSRFQPEKHAVAVRAAAAGVAATLARRSALGGV